jgi:alpha-L-fucosidase
VRNLVEIVCKGGNLLLNVGPTNNGDFPPESRANLATIGRWMEINGEAIYGIHPWQVASEKPLVKRDTVGNLEGKTDDDLTDKAIRPDLFFSSKGKVIYLFARSWREPKIVSKQLADIPVSSITCLGSSEKINWRVADSRLTINMPRQLPQSEVPVYVFRIHLK